MDDSLLILWAQAVPLWALQHLPIAVFIFCFGASVGSFMNVVIYRLPAGISVISPPSRCPVCGVRLTWRENLPIVGWLLLRGRCKACGVRISPQYVIVELAMAVLFLGLYILLFAVPPSTPWWGQLGGPWWHASGLFRLPVPAGAWPAYVALTFMFAGLLAMTVIDARTFTIPIEIPLVVTLIAWAAYLVQGLLPMPRGAWNGWPIPGECWQPALAGFGGLLGIALSTLLLRTGRLRPSFADYQDYLKEGQQLADYPHARREMVAELLFLMPVVVLGLVGWWVGGLMPASPPPVWVQALGGSVLGYLVGGGIVWIVRILGTLAFGREAMGMGDVHLMAAVGAVLGWPDALVVFFLAPFLGLGWAALRMVLARFSGKFDRELPYGPHLAAATLLLVLFRPWIAVSLQVATGLPILPSPHLCP